MYRECNHSYIVVLEYLHHESGAICRVWFPRICVVNVGIISLLSHIFIHSHIRPSSCVYFTRVFYCYEAMHSSIRPMSVLFMLGYHTLKEKTAFVILPSIITPLRSCSCFFRTVAEKPWRAIVRSLQIELALTLGSCPQEGRNLSQWRDFSTGTVSSPCVISVSCSSSQRLLSAGFSYACVPVH